MLDLSDQRAALPASLLLLLFLQDLDQTVKNRRKSSAIDMQVQAVRYIGGYGRMSWVSGTDWLAATPDPIAPHADAILRHMNTDHKQTMVLYCRALSQATDTTDATLKSVDRYGFEMSALTAAGPRPIRLAFSQPVSTPDQVRREMVALANKARSL